MKTGSVAESNLDDFREKALAEIKAANKDLITENDFAEAEEVIKKCSVTEKMIVKTKEDALNQTADIRSLFSALDELSAELRTTRLSLEKKVKSEKESRKSEIIDVGVNKVEEFIRENTNDILDGLMVVEFKAFADAIKGEKTMESMATAVDEVAEWNIEKIKRETALIIANVLKIEGIEANYPGLFPDKKALSVKPHPEIKAIIESRIATFKLQAEEKRQRDEKAKAVADEAVAKATEQAKVEPVAEKAAATTQEAQRVVSAHVSSLNSYTMTISMSCDKESAVAIAQAVNGLLADKKEVTGISLKRMEEAA